MQWAGRVAPCGRPTAPRQAHPGTRLSDLQEPPGPHFTSNGVLSTCQTTAVTADALYIGTGHTIRRVDARTGHSVLLAGAINSICGIAVDHAGNILFAAGTEIQVLAGKGRPVLRPGHAARPRLPISQAPRTADRHNQDLGDNGPARQAAYGRITGLALDPAGNVLISDSGRRDCHGCDDMGSLVRVIAERTGRFYAISVKGRRQLHGGGHPERHHRRRA